MPCYHPLRAFRDSEGIRFVAAATLSNLKIACGQCFGCRLERSRQWAVRCMHEAKQHAENCFVTITYAPENLPHGGTLVKRDHQLFLKRLLQHRKRNHTKAQLARAAARASLSDAEQKRLAEWEAKNEPIPQQRFYMCGEYGEQLQRPHYHFCLFGFDFNDKKYWGTTTAGSKLYRSPTLEKLWPYGHSTVGELTFESAAYAARYVMKKITGKKQKHHYEKIDIETGEILKILPEYNEMSRAQGIGKSWIEKYTADVYNALPGKVIIRGQEANAPKYYDKQLKKYDPARYELIKDYREQEGRKHAADQTPRRLKVKEEVAKAKISSLKRNI